MKLSIYKVLSITAILFVFSAAIGAQTAEANLAQARIDQSLNAVGKAFNAGIGAISNGERSLAKGHFDKSIEEFLVSGIDLSSKQNSRVRDCFNQLIDTIYQIEIERNPKLKNNLRFLSETCRWDLNQPSMSEVARSVVSGLPISTAGASLPQSQSAAEPQRLAVSQLDSGFAEQRFEPAIGDELAAVQLTPDEQQIDANPIAQEQFQYIQVAVANKSLGFSFQVHPMIQQYINYYRGRGRTTMEVGLYRSGMFMRMARLIFKEEGIPENVAWLGQVESAWKPSAMSHMAASGLWQFIPGTGSRYGLKRTAYVDERNSFDEATRASAKYLMFLYKRYGNWELAIAGYNCGEGNVDKAIRRAGVSNFWAAYPYLPQETRNYVPNILATILIANSPNQFGFGHIRPSAPLTYDRVRIPASTNLSLIAQASDSSVQYLRYLNPHLRSNVTPPEPYIVNVPPGKGSEVVALFRRVPASQIPTSNIANSSAGETWQNISNRTGVTVADLMAANPGMASPKGKVFVPSQSRGAGLALTASSRPTNLPITPAPAIKIVKAVLNDTITTVADRLKVSPKELAQFNGLNIESRLFPGRELRVPPTSNK